MQPLCDDISFFLPQFYFLLIVIPPHIRFHYFSLYLSHILNFTVLFFKLCLTLLKHFFFFLPANLLFFFFVSSTSLLFPTIDFIILFYIIFLCHFYYFIIKTAFPKDHNKILGKWLLKELIGFLLANFHFFNFFF